MFKHCTRRILTTIPPRFPSSPTFVLTKTLATTMSPSPPQNPLIILTGSTGTGKSSLAISISQILSRHHPSSSSFEIINADAMQLYSGLPIITNKITADEQQGVPHHLLGTIGLEEETWTVKRFVKECDRIIAEVRARGNVPILVGGTGYYVHGVVLGEGVGSVDSDGVENEDGDEKTDLKKEGGEEWKILDGSTEEIYRKLEEVDPAMARRWHPSDRRKIQRSLEIYFKTGRKASDIYQEQKRKGRMDRNESEDAEEIVGSNGSRTLRYDSLIFWLDAEDAALKDRLNKRVDSMVQNGLIEEAKEMDAFEQEMRQKNIPLDKTKGIWVSIGYKELEPWLDHVKDQSVDAKSAVVLQQSCIEAVKASTRRYAKRQNRYIRIRLAQALAAADASDRLFLLDCTDLKDWQQRVIEPACDIVNTFLRGGELPGPADLSNLAQRTFSGMSDGGDASTDRVARRCETCDKVLMTEKEWLNHIRSRSHKKVLEGIRKRSLYEERVKVVAKARDPKELQDDVQTSNSAPI